LSTRRAGAELVITSFIVLFQELALIRWLPTQVRVTAYFPNLILIGAFLGLGLGALLARRRSILWVWPVSLILVVAAGILMSRVAFTANEVTEHLWLLYEDLPEYAPVVEVVRLPIAISFILGALTFVPLGQIVAERLNVYRAQSSPLWGYAMDLSGSLLGVIGFAFVSLSGTFPIVWFTLFAGMGGVLFLGRGRLWGLYLPSLVLLLLLVAGGERNQFYSPYYALSTGVRQGTTTPVVRTNGSFHQMPMNVRMDEPLEWEGQEEIRHGFHLPYRLLKRPPRKVLVLGAGTGNDVAVALEEGAEEVHAVEIDPVILGLGETLHPNRPYDDPRVTTVVADARSFLNQTEERYDLIVFGTLDSQTHLSALSSVRLDNFVYTRESVEAAARRLEPGGGMVLLFWVGKPHISGHLTVMLSTVFGELLTIQRVGSALFNHIFLAGPAFSHPRESTGEDIPPAVATASSLEMPTDDWPYLYLPGKGLSGFYVSMMLFFAALALASILVASPEMRRGLRSGRGIDWEMFLFGLAFLLIETRFVTAINLVWGATWITSAVVFGSILAMILLATVIMELWPLPWSVASAGLIGCLIGTYLIPTDTLLVESVALRLALSGLYVGAPVFFAAGCFALLFKTREEVDTAFGWNLIGAVVGGLVEFFSMSVGLKALLVVAIGAYLTAFVLKAKSRRATSQGLSG
jgi:SAM-dependent methyltransferase